MSFLERLAREKAEREVAAAGGTAAKLVTDNARMTAALQRENELFALRERAKAHLSTSAFPDMAASLAHTVDGSVHGYEHSYGSGPNNEKYYNIVLIQGDSIGIEIIWDDEFLGLASQSHRVEKHRAKVISIEAKPDGTIMIHSGLGASTTLPYSQWVQNPEIQEHALERAYDHPSTKIFERYRRFEEDSGNPSR